MHPNTGERVEQIPKQFFDLYLLGLLVPRLENYLSAKRMPRASLLELFLPALVLCIQKFQRTDPSWERPVLLKHKRDSALKRKCCLHCPFCIVGRRSSSLLVHGTFCSTKTDTCVWGWLERNNNNVTHLVLTALLETNWFITRVNM